MEVRKWSVGDRVFRWGGPVLTPGGSGTVMLVSQGPYPVCVQWDEPQVSTHPGDSPTPRERTVHWHDELAEAP